MIELMKKVSIVILNREKETALKALKKIGLVHLERLEGSSEKLTTFKEYTNNALLVESVLGETKYAKNKKTKKLQENLEVEELKTLISEIVKKVDRKKQLLEEIASDVNELERFANWGSVNLEDFAYLAEKGIQLKLYEIAAEKYALIDESIETILFNNDKKLVRFLIVNGGSGRPEKLLPEAFEVPFPKMSTETLEKEISTDRNELVEIENYLESNAKYLNAVKDFRIKLAEDIEFENVNAGMEHETEGNINDLAWISGYVPAEKMEEFQNACRENQWAMTYSDPEDDDVEVPTKLKNNKLVSLIYPLTDFLGTVPGYHEYDISGWFLLFFCIFFGMIFGDGGYGLLVTIVTIALMLKNKADKKARSPLLGLVLLLGISTVIWGTVTCTWFGIEMQYLPDWLKSLSIPMISSAYEFNPDGTKHLWVPFWVSQENVGLDKDQILQIFCFSLALIQLSIAHIKAAGRNMKEHRFVKSLGDIGSLLQLIGMFWIVLSMVVSSDVFQMLGEINGFPIGKVEVGLIAVGFALSFIFANYEGNLIKSILESLKNIISVLLGVVNVFSDIVSYIRLWAVGLAGAAISNTVNTLAGPMLGKLFLFIAAIALLGFGHGLNMILNLLSVIVHGVRLNTLEFSTHLGVSWSGIKYEPFKEK